MSDASQEQLPDPVPVRAPAPREHIEPVPTPTFSVIMAAYQVAPFIGEALASAFAQTTPPLEVIVCDDGSTDDLAGAIAPFRERIVLIEQSNRGEAAAKNAAARAASGDFVVILDGDDVDLPGRLAAMGELAAARPDLDIISTDCWLWVDGVRTGRYHHETHPFEIDDQRRRILERNFVYNPAVRRTRWLDMDGFDEGIRAGVADWECWMRLILDGSVAGLVDVPLTLYRQRTGRLTDDRPAMLAGRVAVLEHASRHAVLHPRERAALDEALGAARRRRADEAIAVGHPSARLASRAVLRDSSQPARVRLGAAVGAVSPALARRLPRRH